MEFLEENKDNTDCGIIDDKDNQVKPDYSYEDAVFIAMELGEHILRSGGEISRAEDTITRICQAYGAVTVDVAVMLSVIVLTVDFGNVSINSSRHTYEVGTNNLGKLAKLNALSRKICAELPTKSEFLKELERIKSETNIKLLRLVLGAVLASIGFTVFFGGNYIDGLISGLLVIPMTLLGRLLYNIKINAIVAKFLVCLVGGLCALFACRFGIPLNADKMMIGNIMTVIPGVLLANSFRDLLSGDIMSGFFRLCTAVLDAVVIACGYAVSILILGMENSNSAVNANQLWVVLLASTIGTLGIVFLFGLESNKMIWALLSSIISCAAYEITFSLGGGYLVSALVASALVAAYSDIMAHVLKTPSTVLIISGFVPLVPGGMLYYTMLGGVTSNMAMFYEKGRSALLVATGLAIGIVAVTAITRPINGFLTDIKCKSLNINTQEKK